jgi:hypothetical protein
LQLGRHHSIRRLSDSFDAFPPAGKKGQEEILRVPARSNAAHVRIYLTDITRERSL